MGHSDFYINNANLQLGCPVNKTLPNVISIDKSSLNQGEILPGCSHKRAFKYFIEALSNKNCSFLGLLCDNFQNFTMVLIQNLYVQKNGYSYKWDSIYISKQENILFS